MDINLGKMFGIGLVLRREAIGLRKIGESDCGQRSGSAFKLCGKEWYPRGELAIAVERDEAGLDCVVGQPKAIANLKLLKDLVEMRLDGALADR